MAYWYTCQPAIMTCQPDAIRSLSLSSAAPSSNTGRILAFHPNKSETVRNLQTSRRRGFSLNNRAVGCISHQLRNACASNHAPALGELVRPVEIR